MKPVLAGTAAMSRKLQLVILQALATQGQGNIAAQLDVHESTISRMKEANGEIEKMGHLLATLGLKLIPNTTKMYPEDQINAMFLLLKSSMIRAENAEQFFIGE